MKRCNHSHARYRLRHPDGTVTDTIGCYSIVAGYDGDNFGYGWTKDVLVAICRACGATLPLGPANDSVKPAPLPPRGGLGHHDASAWSWDISRPIAEQLAETARGDAEALTIVTAAVHVSYCDRNTDAAFPCNCDGRESYEASRDAEPDCRDEDDAPAVTSTIPCTLTAAERKAALERLSPTPRYEDEDDDEPTVALDRAVAAVGAMVDAFTDLVKFGADEVCACTGDALESETCEVAP